MIKEDSNITNKVFLVSGATGSIGTELTILLSKQKAHIILMGRDIDKLTNLYDECIKYTDNIHIMQFDLLYANPDNYQALYETINNEFGKIDVFINLAAVWGNFAPVYNYDLKSWYEVMQTNLNSTFMLSQTLMSLLKKSTKPQIVYTTTEQICKNYTGALRVANDGLISLMDSIETECQNTINLTVSRISPEPVDSKLYRKNFPGTITPKLKPIDIANQILDSISTCQSISMEEIIN